MNIIDRAIALLSPAAALKREAARKRLESVRRFEGAALNRRTSGWLAPSTSVNADLWRDLSGLRNRSRNLIANNPWAARGVAVVSANVVGAGILAHVETGAKTRNRRVMDYWDRWADSRDCDADGRCNLYGLQDLVMRTVVGQGECLIRRRKRRPEDGLLVPMQLQILEPDYLDASRDGALPNGGRITQGIETDALGRRQACWLYREHPGDRTTSSIESLRVPASEIEHVFRIERPGQMRGYPWLAPVMLTLHDFDAFEDAYLLRQKLANCIMGFVRGPEGADPISEDEDGFPARMEPGTLPQLPPGWDVTFSNPPPAAGYAEYVKSIQHRIAAGLGITYEALTGDLSDVNFSSGRMGWLEMHRNIDAWRWLMLIPSLDRIATWFVEALKEVANDNMLKNAAWQWSPPRREMIDPTREIPAMRDAIRAGITTLSETIRQTGYNPAEVLAEHAEDNTLLDQLELVFDSDPRTIGKSIKVSEATAADTRDPQAENSSNE